jgi:eukaryotic-like serine/threonine-protein kinase
MRSGSAGVSGRHRRAGLRARVAAAFSSAGPAYLRDLGPGVVARLDRYAHELAQARGEACAATLERGEQSAELMDLRFACLDERRRDLGVLATRLGGEASDDERARAMQAIQALPSIVACADTAALRLGARAPIDPARRLAAETVRVSISEARIATAMGDYARALVLAEAAIAEASKLGVEEIVAEAQLEAGSALMELGRGADAGVMLHAAAAAADASRHDEIAARARISLVFNVGVKEGRLDESDRLVPYAAAAITRLGGSPQLTARLLLYRASALSTATRSADALPLTLEAIAVLERAADLDDLALAHAYNRAGIDTANLGRYADAIAYYDRALAIRERVLGPAHPHVALVLTNRGGMLTLLERYDEAAASHERALAIREQVFGAEHVDVAATLNNLGNTHMAAGRLDQAHAARTRALAIVEAVAPADHPYLPIMRSNLVTTLVTMGRDAETLALCDRSLPAERRARPDHPATGRLMVSCAVATLRGGDRAAAWALYRDGAAQLGRTVGADHPDTISYLAVFAEAAVVAGDARLVVGFLEHAVAVRREVLGEDSDTLALTRIALARAYLAADRPGPAAAPLEAAIATLGKHSRFPDELADARTLLAAARQRSH